ncbi:MAG: DUF4292 domain-containing protein [Haliscomenobacter sp.]|nr:DUF4292 domain-containing protein [Haliscomenobacter sp.]
MNRRFFSGQTTPLLAVALLAGLSFSCSTSKKAGNAGTTDASALILRKLEARQLNAAWFEAKARIDYDDGDLAVKASATIRMQKDSAVWVAVRKLGFEVARVLITPDSLFYIDRFNNEFGAYGLDYLSREYQAPANLTAIQNLLLGNLVYFNPAARTLKPAEGGQFWMEETYAGQLVRHRINENEYRVDSMEYKDLAAGRSMMMVLGEYGPLSGKHNFSYLRNLTLESQETGAIKVELKFSEVELDVPKSLSFDIPERYSRRSK